MFSAPAAFGTFFMQSGKEGGDLNMAAALSVSINI